jgi:predicted dehydrogenase
MTIPRRRLLTLGAAGVLSASSLALPAFGQARPALRLAMIGTGMRGQVLLKELARRSDVEIAALCDIEPIMLTRAQVLLAQADKPSAWTCGEDGDEFAYRRLLARPDLDGVIIATPWEWHAVMAIDAMKAKVPVGCEVVAGVTMQDHWDVLRTQQRTNTPYMLLENVCYRRDVMAVLQMVRAGLFGELVHLQGGYQHDLRGVKFNSGHPDEPYDSGVEFGAKAWSEARWRTQHAVKRNGDLYPSHGIGPLAMACNIHRGNRFTLISAFASKARGLQDYVTRKKGSAAHPTGSVKFALGDVVTTQLPDGQRRDDPAAARHLAAAPVCAGLSGAGHRRHLDGPQQVHPPGRQEPAPPLGGRAALAGPPRPPAVAPLREGRCRVRPRRHGLLRRHAFVEALKARAPMPIDIYDAIAWSAITPLSEQSIAEGFQTLEFPDFTNGRWQTRKPGFALDDRY